MAKFCENCGNEIKENAEVCLNCGKIINKNIINNNTNNNGYNNRSKIGAGILGILFGSLGVHNFYLGFKGKAIAQLLLTLLSCGILAPVTYIWGLIEGIMILTGSINRDADGNPLSN